MNRIIGVRASSSTRVHLVVFLTGFGFSFLSVPIDDFLEMLSLSDPTDTRVVARTPKQDNAIILGMIDRITAVGHEIEFLDEEPRVDRVEWQEQTRGLSVTNIPQALFALVHHLTTDNTVTTTT